MISTHFLDTVRGITTLRAFGEALRLPHLIMILLLTRYIQALFLMISTRTLVYSLPAKDPRIYFS